MVGVSGVRDDAAVGGWPAGLSKDRLAIVVHGVQRRGSRASPGAPLQLMRGNEGGCGPPRLNWHLHAGRSKRTRPLRCGTVWHHLNLCATTYADPSCRPRPLSASPLPIVVGALAGLPRYVWTCRPRRASRQCLVGSSSLTVASCPRLVSVSPVRVPGAKRVVISSVYGFPPTHWTVASGL